VGYVVVAGDHQRMKTKDPSRHVVQHMSSAKKLTTRNDCQNGHILRLRFCAWKRTYRNAVLACASPLVDCSCARMRIILCADQLSHWQFAVSSWLGRISPTFLPASRAWKASFIIIQDSCCTRECTGRFFLLGTWCCLRSACLCVIVHGK
jgi:hypothetical protein